MTLWQLEPGYRAIERFVQACPTCGGAWVDRPTLDELVRGAAAVAEARGSSEPIPRQAIEERVVYRKCPSCAQMMHRRNFGRISGVIVDECRRCGTWFDEGELEAVLAFVRAGGLALAHAREQQEAEREAARRTPPPPPSGVAALGSRDVMGHGFASWELETELLGAFGRWIARRLKSPSR
jgi:Zn-finger nucleic acid-binding protein